MDKDYPQGLYITATPIGNMGDLTFRALDILKSADVIICEDTRETGKLCSGYGISVKMIPYHDHNAAQMRPKIVSMIKEGKRVALVSDAGMPLVSDPGYKLVELCVQEGVYVTCMPGASASLMALVLSGLPADRFFFAGFLPPKTGARKKSLEALKAVPSTLIFYETAPRLVSSLADMHAVLGDRLAAVTRELTKKFEEVRRGTLSELVAHYTENGEPKGEIAIVIGGPLDVAEVVDIDGMLEKAMQDMSVKDAAAFVAAQSGVKKKDVYTRALELKNTNAG